MSRKVISPKVQADVLLKSRRRCCICFGLHRDTNIKQGQIAHLDQDASNNVEANLAFLCFNHHDQYDSTTRQSKNFTKLEVTEFKKELYDCLNTEFLKKYNFGNNEENEHEDNYLGCYIRDGEYESAEINIQSISENSIQITGLALWGKTREVGANLGELNFVGQIIENQIFFADRSEENGYWIKIIFLQDALIVEENAFTGYHGMNVTFQGTYHRVKE